MDIKPIRTPEDHAHALKEIERLWNTVQKNTPEGDYFEILLALVHAYDNDHHPMQKPDPIAAIKFRMEQQGLSNKDLQPIIGTRGRVSEILSKRRHLTLEMMRRLNAKLGISMETLARSYKLKSAATSTKKRTGKVAGKMKQRAHKNAA
jgi:HTH-type transcriptional regulator/antitoxin HigA